MSQQLTLQPPARAPKDSLRLALDRLCAALEEPVPGNERQWAFGVNAALAGLEASVRLYRAATRDMEGPFAEIDVTRPSLARQADELRSQQECWLARILSLRQEVQQAEQAFQQTSERLAVPAGKTVCDFGEIRRNAEEILAGLEENKETESRLVLESVCTDIGAGD